MKKSLLICFAFVLLLAACNRNETQISSSSSDKPTTSSSVSTSSASSSTSESSSPEETTSPEQLNQMLQKKIETADLNFNELKALLDENINEVSMQTADIFIKEMLKKSETNLLDAEIWLGNTFKGQQKLLDALYYEPVDLIGAGKYETIKILDDTDRVGLTEFFDKGLGLVVSEGYFYFIIDYSFYQDFYGDIVSGQMNEYVKIMYKSDYEPIFIEETIVITPVELAERTILYEKYLQNYTNEYGFDNIKQLYLSAIWGLVTPSYHSTLTNYSFNLSQETKNAYAKLLEESTFEPTQMAIADIQEFLNSEKGKNYSGSFEYNDLIYTKAREILDEVENSFDK